jgi:peroxiredoxin Q/BCP
VAYFAASIDRPETNRRFAESLDLDFPILSDPDRTTARAYGVLRGFGLYASRQTFFIGEDGNILHIEARVRARDAGAQVANRLAGLGLPVRR